MNKEKQIEELARILFDESENYCDSDGCIITEKLAEQLYNAGYRKLSKEAQEMVSNALVYSKRLKIEKSAEQVRKETAKEILQFLWNTWWERQINKPGCRQGIRHSHLEQLAKAYGVEIEE